MTGIGRAAFGVGNMSERANAQLRAMGTTLRYAFAGGVIFGSARLVRDLSEVQRQLAMIHFLGDFSDTSRSADQARERIVALYGDAQRGSVEALTPVAEFNDALINLYSTIEARPEKEMVGITTAIAQGAQLAQAPVDDLTRAVSGMNQAFGETQDLANYQRMIRGFVEFTSKAPGGPAYGPQFIQQLAPLAAVSKLAAITPQEMFGLYLTSVRTGATPATAGRGLQYLMQSIAVPASDESRRALAQAGINPGAVQQMGGRAALQKIIEHVRGMGGLQGAGNLSGMTEEQLDMLESTGDTGQALRGLGVGGPALDWLSQAIGRIHGIRALVTLMAQGGQSEKDIDTISMAMSDTAAATHDFAQKWAEFREQQPLRAAGVSLDVIRRNIASAFEPLLNVGANQVSALGGEILQHPTAARRGTQAAGLGLAAMGLYRLLGGGFGRAGRFLGRGGQMAVQAQAMQAVTQRGVMGPIGTTPTNPLFVTVVGQLFGGGTPTTPGTPGDIPGKQASWLRRAAPWLGAGGMASLRYLRGMGPRVLRHGAKLGPLAAFEFLRDAEYDPLQGAPPGAGRAGGNERYMMNLIAARAAVPGTKYYYGAQRDTIRGQAYVTLDVLVKQPGQKQPTRKRVHVPMELWQGAMPSTRGRAGRSMRGG